MTAPDATRPAATAAPSPSPSPYGTAPVGRVRSTGTCVLLFVVTLGIYGLFWYYATHDEMKRHTGQGLGGGLALVLALFAGVVSPFLVSSEVGELYARRGQARPVSGATGLWYLPGILLLVPGSVGYRSLSSFMERQTLAGIEIAFNMILTAVALVAGLLIAGVIAPEPRLDVTE